MSRKPKIFKPNMDFVDNNKKTYYSFLEDRLDIDTEKANSDNEVNSSEEVMNFINKLSNSNSYVFNKNIVIVTKDGKFETRIAGKMGNRLITLDNKSIDIDDIINIYEK